VNAAATREMEEEGAPSLQHNGPPRFDIVTTSQPATVSPPPPSSRRCAQTTSPPAGRAEVADAHARRRLRVEKRGSGAAGRQLVEYSAASAEQASPRGKHAVACLNIAPEHAIGSRRASRMPPALYECCREGTKDARSAVAARLVAFTTYS